MIRKMLRTSAIISLSGLAVSILNYISLYYISLYETKESLNLFFKVISVPFSISGLISNAIALFLPTLLVGLNLRTYESERFINFLKQIIILNVAISIVLLLMFIYFDIYTLAYSAISFLQGAALIYFSIEVAKNNSSGRFSYAYLASIAASLFSTILLFFFYKRFGLIALPASQTLCLFIAGKLISQRIVIKKESLHKSSSIHMNFFLAIISLSGNSLWPAFDAFWISLYNQNSLGVISIAQKLQISIAGLIITGIYTVLGTHFQGKTIEDNLETIKKMIFFVLLSSFILIFFMLCMYLFFSNFIRSFLPDSLDGIIPVFFILQVGMAFMIISTLLLRFYCSTFRYFTAAKIGIFFCFLYFIFSGFLSKDYGANGIAFSYTLSWFLTSLLFAWPLFIRKI